MSLLEAKDIREEPELIILAQSISICNPTHLFIVPDTSSRVIFTKKERLFLVSSNSNVIKLFKVIFKKAGGNFNELNVLLQAQYDDVRCKCVCPKQSNKTTKIQNVFVQTVEPKDW